MCATRSSASLGRRSKPWRWCRTRCSAMCWVSSPRAMRSAATIRNWSGRAPKSTGIARCSDRSDGEEAMRASQRLQRYSADVMALARRRRLKRVVVALLLGAVLGAYTYGALDLRATDRDDLLPQWLEAVLLGGAFAVASMPVGWSILGRVLIPIPTLVLYLTVFL